MDSTCAEEYQECYTKIEAIQEALMDTPYETQSSCRTFA